MLTDCRFFLEIVCHLNESEILVAGKVISLGYVLYLCVGNILGITLDAGRLVAMFRKVRRAGLISEFVSISPNHKHRLVHIACDGGRVCRSAVCIHCVCLFV